MAPSRWGWAWNHVPVIAAAAVALLILLTQTIFIVPAGQLAVGHQLSHQVTAASRSPGPNIKGPVDSVQPRCSMCATECGGAVFSTLTKGSAGGSRPTATVKYGREGPRNSAIYETIATTTPRSMPRHSALRCSKALKSCFPQ